MRKPQDTVIPRQCIFALVAGIILCSTTYSQVILKERVPIDPGNPSGFYSGRHPFTTPPDLYLVMPRAGLMQLEIQYAWKLYSAMPSTAYLRIALPETTYTTTVNDFFNTFVSFPVTNFDNCQNQPVPATYTKFSGYRSTQYPIKLLFVRIPRTGDTLRFTLHDNVDIPVTILSGDSSQGWSISNSVDPQNVQCWTAPDKLEASSSVFKYADTVFVGFRVKPDVDAIFYGAATPVRATAVNSSGNEVYIDASIVMEWSESEIVLLSETYQTFPFLASE